MLWRNFVLVSLVFSLLVVRLGVFGFMVGLGGAATYNALSGRVRSSNPDLMGHEGVHGGTPWLVLAVPALFVFLLGLYNAGYKFLLVKASLLYVAVRGFGEVLAYGLTGNLFGVFFYVFLVLLNGVFLCWVASRYDDVFEFSVLGVLAVWSGSLAFSVL